ncbi:hypothetical protein HZC53_02715 [Candidatus Uhrbacteria bacterium]|nr:hypothetical protein [Candidatus Uhrbacteria bacterium]
MAVFFVSSFIITDIGTVRAEDVPTGTLYVVTQVLNNSGSGSKSAGDFTMTITGANPTPASFAGTPNVTAVTVNADEIFSVDQTLDASYDTTFGDGCFGKVTAGDNVTCVVTSDDIEFFEATTGTLVLVTQVINDDSGSKRPDDFTSVISTDNTTDHVMGSSDGATVILPAGSYDVSEIGTDGYGTTFSAGCSGSLAVGETRTCTVTNDDISPYEATTGTLSVVVQVQNGYGGTKTSSDFTLNVTGNSPVPNSFSGSSAGTDVVLVAGSYSVDAVADANYTESIGPGCNGAIGVGQNPSCVITEIEYRPVPNEGTSGNAGGGGSGGGWGVLPSSPSAGLQIDQSSSAPLPEVLGMSTDMPSNDISTVQPSSTVIIQPPEVLTGQDSAAPNQPTRKVAQKRSVISAGLSLDSAPDQSAGLVLGQTSPKPTTDTGRVTYDQAKKPDVVEVAAKKFPPAVKKRSALASNGIPTALVSLAMLVAFSGLCLAGAKNFRRPLETKRTKRR